MRWMKIGFSVVGMLLLGGCAATGGINDCAPACSRLASCELCVRNSAGDCMDTAGCTSACRADTTSHTKAGCVNQAGSCSAVMACFGSSTGSTSGGGSCSAAGGYIGAIPGDCSLSCSGSGTLGTCRSGWTCNGSYCQSDSVANCIRCPE